MTRKDGHHPIISMHCGPVRYRVDAKQQAAQRSFAHNVLVRPTSFRAPESPDSDARIQFHALYDALIADESRNRLICDDVLAAVRTGRSPVVLTERTDHLSRLATALTPAVRHVIVLQGVMGKKALAEALARLAAVPQNEERVVLATGRFSIGDSRRCRRHEGDSASMSCWRSPSTGKGGCIPAGRRGMFSLPDTMSSTGGMFAAVPSETLCCGF